jgi:hypothetical protein
LLTIHLCALGIFYVEGRVLFREQVGSFDSMKIAIRPLRGLRSPELGSELFMIRPVQGGELLSIGVGEMLKVKWMRYQWSYVDRCVQLMSSGCYGWKICTLAPYLDFDLSRSFGTIHVSELTAS